MKKNFLVFLLVVIVGCGNNAPQTDNERGYNSLSEIEKEKRNRTATDIASIGYERSQNEDFIGAIDSYSTAIKYNPYFTQAYLNRGHCKFKLKDFRGAIADFNKTIELDPASKVAYYNRGLAKILSGDKDNGCMDLSKSGELGFAQAYKAIGQYCQ